MDEMKANKWLGINLTPYFILKFSTLLLNVVIEPIFFMISKAYHHVKLLKIADYDRYLYAK